MPACITTTVFVLRHEKFLDATTRVLVMIGNTFIHWQIGDNG